VADLDVRIDEIGIGPATRSGRAGTADSRRWHPPSNARLTMRFYPALQHGTLVAVWCRQRFAFGRDAAAEPDSEHP